MLHHLELARLIQEDREREIQKRARRMHALPSGPRHPARPETSELDDLAWTNLRARRTRPAYGG